MGCQSCKSKKVIVQTFKQDVNELIERIKKARNVKTPKSKEK